MKKGDLVLFIRGFYSSRLEPVRILGDGVGHRINKFDPEILSGVAIKKHVFSSKILNKTHPDVWEIYSHEGLYYARERDVLIIS